MSPSSPLMVFLVTVVAFTIAMVGAFALSRWLTGLSRGLALRWGVISLVSDRSSHTEPTPRLGGLGLALGFSLAAGFFLFVLWLLPHSRAIIGFNPSLVTWAALGWVVFLGVGALDDFFDLKPLVKLALMTIGALTPVIGGATFFPLPSHPAVPSWLHGAVEIIVTTAWLLFFVNTFNFMDGMDGFAASFGAIASLFMAAVVLLEALNFRPGVTVDLLNIRAESALLLLLAMACWGFLHWNFPTARVFMGDAGSLSIGYLLALSAVIGHRGSFERPLPFIASLTILLPFIFDVVLTLIRRVRHHENLLQAHHGHLYQRLLQTGLSHAQVLVLNLSVFWICGALALAAALFDHFICRWCGFVAALVLMIIYWRHVTWREQRAQRAASSQRPG